MCSLNVLLPLRLQVNYQFLKRHFRQKNVYIFCLYKYIPYFRLAHLTLVRKTEFRRTMHHDMHRPLRFLKNIT
jgi:hypothetical protein